MCGINGFLGDFPQDLIHLMNETTAHRGPDDRGSWSHSEDSICLGHNRLSIIDLSQAGHQPMIDSNERFVMVYNGEVYNFPELKKDLEKKNYKFRGQSDSEVLLNLYIEEGEDCVKKLNGIFAFAVWDKKEKELFLARDHYGVKPLYYSHTERGFIFSSELKSLLHSKCVSKEINENALSRYLAFLWSPGCETMLKGVSKLLPGHSIRIGPSKEPRVKQFYQLDYSGSANSTEGLSFEEAKTKTRTLLKQAVKRQMISDVEVGAFLSGGVDSTAIVNYAKEYSSQRMNCFTIKTDEKLLAQEGIVSDYSYAKKAAKELDVNLHSIEVSETCIDELEEVIYLLDEPEADPAIINTLLISRLARKEGVPVLLSGAGGDDLFSGYRRHLAVHYQGWMSGLPSLARMTALPLLKSSRAFGVPKRYIEKLSRPLNYSGNDFVSSFFLWADSQTINSLLTGEKSGLDDKNLFAPLNNTIKNCGAQSSLRKMLSVDMLHFLTDHNLNYTDKMSMAASIETRVPFLDRDLVDFSLTVPDQYKINGKENKYLLREALRGEIPDFVLDRPKTGFGAPLRGWIKGPLKPFIDEHLSKEKIDSVGIFDFTNVSKVLETNAQGKKDQSYLIYSILCIQVWAKIFLSGKIKTI